MTAPTRTRHYRSPADAIRAEVLPRLRPGHADRFDLDAIADEVLGIDDDGVFLLPQYADELPFWQVVAKHERRNPPKPDI